MPYQLYTGQLPSDLISEMINFARPNAQENKSYLRVFAENALKMIVADGAKPAEDVLVRLVSYSSGF